MIQLRSDCLVFEVSGGDKIPCSVEKLTIEVLADSVEALDPEVIRQAASAVLHYFKDDLGRDTVTIDEFTGALEHVLRGLGYDVQSSGNAVWPLPDSTTTVAASEALPSPEAEAAAGSLVDVDLEALASELGDGLELNFYLRLRGELRTRLAESPRVLRFRGLRSCAKRIAGVSRWCPRSLEVSDQIVRYLRDCWGAEHPRKNCALWVN
jgi:hypothetical protein